MSTASLQAARAAIDRGFAFFWFVRVGSTAGQQVMGLALGWQMYELTRQAWDLGLIGLFQFVPSFALGLVAGQLADRWHRGRIVTLCLATQALAAALLVHADLTHAVSRDLLLAVAVLLGAARGFQLPAQQALLPLLVAPAQLPRATALVAGGGQLAIIGGPALGGGLLVFGALPAQLACLVLFVFAGLMAAAIRLRPTQRPTEPVSVRSMLAGAQFVWRSKTMLGALSLDLVAVMFGGVVALLPMFARDVLQVGPAGLGLLRSAPAAGALAMSLVLSQFPLQRHVGRKMMVAAVVYGGSMLGFGLSHQMSWSLFLLACSGCADMVSVVVRHTLVQLETPERLRGRVGAVNALFMGASNQLGEFESGATAALWGPVGSVVFGGVVTLAAAVLWLRLFPSLWRRDRFEPAAEAGAAPAPSLIACNPQGDNP